MDPSGQNRYRGDSLAGSLERLPTGTRGLQNAYTSKTRMIRFLPLVLKNCWRNRRRTFLTIASISVSMCLLGVMIAMYHALYLSDATPEQALRIVTRNKISLTQQMPESYKNRIKQIPGVRDVMVSQWFGGTYKDPKNFFARFAADSDKIFTIYQELKIPDDQRIAFERDRTGCVIGRDLANKYNLKVGDRMALTGDIFPGNYEFTVRGIFDSPRASEIMYFSREYL
jgi:putative ABC transport system permease protein